MDFGELVTIDGKLFVKSGLDCHGDKPIPVIRGYESFYGEYWFITEEPKKDDFPKESFGFYQGNYGWEWTYIFEEGFKPLVQSNRIWLIKESDLPYAGKRGD